MTRRILAAIPLLFGTVLLAGCAAEHDLENYPNRNGPAAGVSAGGSAAAESPDASEPEPANLTGLSDCLAYAALHNPGLEAAFEQWKATYEKILQARTLPDPRLTYRVFIEQVETRVGPQLQGAGIAQMFPWFGKLELRAGVADEAAKAAGQRYQAAKLALFYRVKRAWYEDYYLERAIAVTAENRRIVENLEGVVRTRYKAAAAGQPDLIRVQVELGKLDDRLRALQAMREPVRAKLNAALGRATDAPLPVPAAAPEERIAADDAQVLAWLAEDSPTLAAMDHEAEARRRQIDLARKDFYPDLTVGVDWTQVGEARMPGVPDSGKDVVMGMFSINVPIWHEKYNAAAREAMAGHRAALASRQETANTLAADLKMALYGYRDANRKINLYRDTLLPKARQALRSTETAFVGGKATYLDLMDAERILLEFQLSHERALADSAQRLAEVEMLVGRPIPRAAEESGVGSSE